VQASGHRIEQGGAIQSRFFDQMHGFCQALHHDAEQQIDA